ncbi:MAG: hypothetical protein MUO84_04535 [Thermoplasmata archaeon]|nr:hypothetical protein [Thermoplasmata archaeon]
MTRRQWRITILMIAIAIAVCVSIFIFVITQVIPENEICCVSGIIIGVVFAMVFVIWVRYWTGRSEAEEEEKKKWRDP